MTTRSEQRPQLLYSASSGDDAQSGTGKQETKGHSSPESEFELITTTTTTTATATTTTTTIASTPADSTDGDYLSENKGESESCVNGDGDEGGGSNEASKSSAAATPSAAAPSSGFQHHFYLEHPRPQMDNLDPQLLQVMHLYFKP